MFDGRISGSPYQRLVDALQKLNIVAAWLTSDWKKDREVEVFSWQHERLRFRVLPPGAAG